MILTRLVSSWYFTELDASLPTYNVLAQYITPRQLFDVSSLMHFSFKIYYKKKRLSPSCADCLEILEASTSWSPEGLSRPIMEYIYVYL
jgi:hypothetical protein